MMALDVVITDTKMASDAQPVDTSAKFVQKWDISQKCVSSKMRNSSTSRQFEHIQRIHHSPNESDESFHDANEEYMPSDDDCP